MARDPVCGMTVDPAKAAAHFAHRGETYFFCAQGCAQKFSADPERYLNPAPFRILDTSRDPAEQFRDA